MRVHHVDELFVGGFLDSEKNSFFFYLEKFINYLALSVIRATALRRINVPSVTPLLSLALKLSKNVIISSANSSAFRLKVTSLHNAWNCPVLSVIPKQPGFSL